MFFTKTKWKKANSNCDSETIIKILEFEYVNLDLDADEVELFSNSLYSSIRCGDDNLFDYLVNYAPDKVIFKSEYSETTLGQYTHNQLIDYLKQGIQDYNLDNVEYILKKLDKKTVTDPHLWGEHLTILNYALYVSCNQSMPGTRFVLMSDYFEKNDTEWIIKARAKLLLFLINYDPQVNTSMSSDISEGYSYPKLKGNATPLHLEVTSGFYCHNYDMETAVLEELLKRGANSNAQNTEGKTPLHLCSEDCQIKLLLDNGANPNIEDNQGRTPYELHELIHSLSPIKVHNPHQNSESVKEDFKDIDDNVSLAPAFKLWGAFYGYDESGDKDKTPKDSCKEILESKGYDLWDNSSSFRVIKKHDTAILFSSSDINEVLEWAKNAKDVS